MSLLTNDTAGLPPCPRGLEHIKRTRDRTGVITAQIMPGEFYVTTTGELIKTTLGSCVSACMRDPDTGIGGMNHFLLPIDGTEKFGGTTGIPSTSTRYGVNAMEELINTILRAGGLRTRLEVKVFGGGNVLQGSTDIGQKNIEFVREFLRNEGFKISSEDLGGPYSRVVIYAPVTGNVRVRQSVIKHRAEVSRQEEQFRKSLVSKPKAGDIDLF